MENTDNDRPGSADNADQASTNDASPLPQEGAGGGRDPEKMRTYWRANRALVRNLLIVWAVVSLGGSILFVETLNKFTIGKLPLGFWMAQQGSIYVFVILIFVYAWRMDKLDRDHDVH